MTSEDVNLYPRLKFLSTMRPNAIKTNTEDVTLPVDSKQYNIFLSRNRANVVKQKLLDMGIPESRMTIEYYGKDQNLPKVTAHDAARRVELIIHTK